MFQFDLPKDQSAIIKVIGVGGGGGNAVNHMYDQDIEGVDFIICNTDAQAIKQSKVPNKIQLGPTLTQGLGAGANPEIGAKATEESIEEIKKILEVNTKMAFITAGMGGGTGTGGAPILAKICKDLGILTVGIVTTPFAYEGKRRIAQAEEGIMLLKEHVDTLLVISNDKMRHQFGNLKMKEAFNKADNVLATAAKCITDVINTTGEINVDFADVSTVMKNGGVAILGSAMAEGEDRAQVAIENALNSPLLNDDDIHGAKWILININAAPGEHEFTMDEVEIIQTHLISQAGADTDVILGLGYDESLGANIGITIIATGFEHKDPFAKKPEVLAAEAKASEKVMLPLQMPSNEAPAERKTKTTDQSKLAFDDEKSIENTVQQAEDLMKPTLASDEPPTIVENKKEAESTDPQFFEISSAADQTPVVEFDLAITPAKAPEKTVAPQSTKATEPTEKKAEVEDKSFLAKPSNIYAPPITPTEKEAKLPEEKASKAVELKVTNEEEEDQPQEFTLFVKEEKKSTAIPETNDKTRATEQSTSTTSVEAVADDTEMLRQRAMERIAKLRKLSFNQNGTDLSNEYEDVPAYMRRNLELDEPIANVETFYSNYTVKNDDKKQADINTINTFLDGKKPD